MFKLVSVLLWNGLSESLRFSNQRWTWLYSTVIVFGFLEIQSNNVPVSRYILNQINKTYTCTFLGLWILLSKVIFFQSLIHLPQTKQKLHNPLCYSFFLFCFVLFFFFILKQLLFFFGNSVYVYFRGGLQYSLSLSLTLHKNLNFVAS